MTDTLNWIYTKDHRPTFEECEGRVVIYHRQNWSENDIWRGANLSKDEYNRVFFSNRFAPIDRYCIPDPEPVPCKVCGCKPEVDNLYGGGQINVRCMSHDDHHVYYFAPTRAEAIQLWNKWNGG